MGAPLKTQRLIDTIAFHASMGGGWKDDDTPKARKERQ